MEEQKHDLNSESPTALSETVRHADVARRWGARRHTALFLLIFVILLSIHAPLLRLPYIWDESGYYVPAARDLLLTGSLIPRSTVSNAHPPLVLLWLALWWKIAGYSFFVTRFAMLLISAMALLSVFRLTLSVSNLEIAIASTMCTGLYSVFFVQSSLAHLDMAAAAFTLLGLCSHLESRRSSGAIWFSLAALSKETAVLAPFALLVWELASRRIAGRALSSADRRQKGALWLLVPFVPLCLWYAYHYARTGQVFGNPEFLRYNLTATLHPLRILLAGGFRIWQLLGYMNLWLLTLAAALAMFLSPLRTRTGMRPRISIQTQLKFSAVTLAYIAAMATVGGAVLARYMLPVLPLVVIICVSTLWRRVHYFAGVVGLVCIAFIAAWFVNPPYGFSFEDNLAYRDYILLHQNAAKFLKVHYASARVLTAWPASDELTRPYLGYVTQTIPVMRIDDFSLQSIESAADLRLQFDYALVFSTKYLPPRPLLEGWRTWENLKTKFFGFHRDLPPSAIAQILGGNVVYSETRNGQWIAILELEHIIDANASTSREQMTRVSLHDQPDDTVRSQVKRVASGQCELRSHLNPAIHGSYNDHISLLKRADFTWNNVARAQPLGLDRSQ